MKNFYVEVTKVTENAEAREVHTIITSKTFNTYEQAKAFAINNFSMISEECDIAIMHCDHAGDAMLIEYITLPKNQLPCHYYPLDCLLYKK